MVKTVNAALKAKTKVCTFEDLRGALRSRAGIQDYITDLDASAANSACASKNRDGHNS